MHFNPRSPHGERRWRLAKPIPTTYFNPRSPRGERLIEEIWYNIDNDFNPRSPRGERHPIHLALQMDSLSISIHAPRGGSDVYSFRRFAQYCNFNPRSPRGERQRLTNTGIAPPSFQSTLPVGGATFERCWIDFKVDISIHAPREGSDVNAIKEQWRYIFISIHAPREGSDYFFLYFSFQFAISIHAPREGSDNCSQCFQRRR